MKTQQERIKFLADYARKSSSIKNTDWEAIGVSETDIFTLMATEVIKSIDQCHDDQKLLLSMGSMTSLLVENFILSTKK